MMRRISSSPIFNLLLRQKFPNPHRFPFCAQAQQNPSPENLRRAVPVSVWWDFENCNLPAKTDASEVGQCIANAVRASGINGPIKITAFGDMKQITRTNQEALSATGISLIHVPSGGKNSADRSLLVDLLYWVSKNPPPAHLFMISGDRDFASVLHCLRMSNYNVLLASSDNAPSVLCSAATIMWSWASLLKGENLIGKRINQPPDVIFNSWYGCSSKDPIAVSEQCNKIRPIPKAVRKRVCRILGSYPEGISVTSLCSELLDKGDPAVDNDLYGYKNFSHFLLAMPNFVNLLGLGNGGHLIVRRVVGKTKKPLTSEPKAEAPPTKNKGV